MWHSPWYSRAAFWAGEAETRVGRVGKLPQCVGTQLCTIPKEEPIQKEDTAKGGCAWVSSACCLHILPAKHYADTAHIVQVHAETVAIARVTFLMQPRTVSRVGLLVEGPSGSSEDENACSVLARFQMHP
eukprot:6462362-Amphidinium_carterae.2